MDSLYLFVLKHVADEEGDDEEHDQNEQCP